MKRMLLTTVAVLAMAAQAPLAAQAQDAAPPAPAPVQDAAAVATSAADTPAEKPKWDVNNPPGPHHD
ncbi:MAG: hypothetical protein JWR59_1359, partial [Brevundimonas sp.]|nr:hypothetical protein [Brevundimonas sp.]